MTLVLRWTQPSGPLKLRWRGLTGEMLEAVTANPARPVAAILGPRGPSGAEEEQNSAFTYTSGKLTRIDYADGSYKTLTYAADLLTRVDYVKNGQIFRKDYSYANGQLVSVVQTTLTEA